MKRRLSAPSANAVTKLVVLRDTLDELDAELAALAHEYDALTGPEKQDPIALGLLVDRVAKVGARGHATEPKVDAVATRSLVSAKEDARALRKRLVGRIERFDDNLRSLLGRIQVQRREAILAKAKDCKSARDTLGRGSDWRPS